MGIKAVRIIVFDEKDRNTIRYIWESEYKLNKNKTLPMDMQKMFIQAIETAEDENLVEIALVREESE
jgi:hypothetical protein